MKPYLLLAFLLTLLACKTSAQTRIRLEKAKKYIGKTVEVVGHVYFQKSVNKDFVILKLAYSSHSPSMLMYYKFRNASSFASLTNLEFGHFRGLVGFVKTTPVIIVTDLHHASFYTPNDERVDSGIYYLNEDSLQRKAN